MLLDYYESKEDGLKRLYLDIYSLQFAFRVSEHPERHVTVTDKVKRFLKRIDIREAY